MNTKMRTHQEVRDLYWRQMLKRLILRLRLVFSDGKCLHGFRITGIRIRRVRDMRQFIHGIKRLSLTRMKNTDICLIILTLIRMKHGALTLILLNGLKKDYLLMRIFRNMFQMKLQNCTAALK